MSSTMESLLAIALFLMTPRSLLRFDRQICTWTRQNMKSQYDYAKRVRAMTASRVNQFSEVFRQLSQSFKPSAS